MTEGARGAFDKGAARPYESRSLPQERVDMVLGRMRGPVRLEMAADQLRHTDGVVGRRVALGLQRGSRSVEDALVEAGQSVRLAQDFGTWKQARTPDELRSAGYFPVEDFGPGEIGEVQGTLAGQRGMLDTRYVGYFDASQEGGFTLGVVDTEEHTRTEIPWIDPHGPRGHH
jgi:hypothetical protein